MINIPFCDHGHGYCTAPDTDCPHWQGTFCELDKTNEELNAMRRAKNSLCGKCEKFDGCEQTVLSMAKCLASLEED